jgi:hypothetical protein
MDYVNKLIFLFVFTLFVLTVQVSLAKSAQQLEWRVETGLKKLERIPAYAGERTPFTVKEKPKAIKKRVVKIERPKELNAEQVQALRAADVLNEIRTVLNNEEIFNADTSTLKVSAVMSIDGVKSALIKNRWYEEGSKLDVPVAAKENLLSLVDALKKLDRSLAEVVENQVQEKIQIIKNLSLQLDRIDDNQVHFSDEQGKKHVIKIRNL